MGAVNTERYSGLAWANEILRKDPRELENALRLIGYTALGVISATGSSAPLLTNLTTRFLTTADFITSIQIATSMKYWEKGEWRNAEPIKVATNAIFTSVTAGCGVMLLDQLKFLDVGKIAASIGGKIPLLRPLTSLTATFVLRSQLAVGFAFLNVMEIRKLSQQNNEATKRQIMIDIAQWTSQIALNVLIIVSASATSPAIIFFGVVAYGLAGVSCIHRYVNDAEINNHGQAPVHAPAPAMRNLTSIGEGYAHVLDFTSKLATKFEGWDSASKFGVGIIESFKFFSTISIPVAEVGAMLGDAISINKVTKLVGHVQNLKKEWNFADTAGLVCLTVSTLFDITSFYWLMSNLGKPSTVFKVWKNGIFMMGLFSGAIKDSRDIKASQGKRDNAHQHLDKWTNRKGTVNSLATMRDYYAARLQNAARVPTSKYLKWTNLRNQIQTLLDNGVDDQERINTFNSNVDRKIIVWDSNKKYFINDIEDKKGKWNGSVLKMTSIALDLGKITLDVCAISAVVIPGIGVNFAVLYWTRAAFTVTNLALGIVGMNSFYFKVYSVEEHKAEMRDQNIPIPR